VGTAGGRGLRGASVCKLGMTQSPDLIMHMFLSIVVRELLDLQVREAFLAIEELKVKMETLEETAELDLLDHW